MGDTEDILNMEPADKKIDAFGWDVLILDGHDHSQIETSLAVGKEKKNGKPTALIANTIKGKGVSFMENDNLWHYSHVNEEVLNKALEELNG